MSLLAAALAVLLGLLVGALHGAAAGAAAQRARAQAAADAAALAAVSESGPYGGGDPAVAARTFAAANGGRVLACECRRGAREMEVTVVVGPAVARARARFEAALVAALGAAYHGLHPVLAAAVERLVDASGGRVRVVSGYRSPEEQARLWEEALARHGSPEAADDWVARPGTSMHERGLAVDLGGDLDLAVQLIKRLGLPLVRPMSWEPWHFELARPGRPPP